MFNIFNKKDNSFDLYELLKNENVQIIDVRTEGEFNNGHVENSKNIPVDQVPKLLDEFKEMPKPIILCCASGARSRMATEYLSKFGIEEVYNGGSWRDVQMQKIK